MNTFQQQQHTFQQQQLRDMQQQQRRHGGSVGDAAHNLRCEQMAAEHAARVAAMDAEYDEGIRAMNAAHAVAVAEMHTVQVATPSLLANIHNLDDVRAHFARQRWYVKQSYPWGYDCFFFSLYPI